MLQVLHIIFKKPDGFIYAGLLQRIQYFFLFHFPVRQVKKDDRRYYEDLLKYSRCHLMLYPYHLSDITVKGLRITPFSYYLNMMHDIMSSEKSYDSLPNFTAADCE